MRPGLRHVCRADRRGGAGRHDPRSPSHPYTQALLRRDADRRRGGRRALRDPGPDPGARRARGRLPLRRPLPLRLRPLRRASPAYSPLAPTTGALLAASTSREPAAPRASRGWSAPSPAAAAVAAANEARAVDDVTLRRSCPARPSASSASRAPASRRCCAWCCACCAPTAGRVLLDGRDVWALRGPELQELRRTVQPVFQDPGASFNPRQTVRAHPRQRRSRSTAWATRRRARRADRGGADLVGLSAAVLDRLAAPALGRAEAARRDRPRRRSCGPACCCWTSRPRRSTSRSRRRCSTCSSAPSASSASPASSSATISPSIRYVSDRVAVMRHGKRGRGRPRRRGLRPAAPRLHPGPAARRPRRRPRRSPTARRSANPQPGEPSP